MNVQLTISKIMLSLKTVARVLLSVKYLLVAVFAAFFVMGLVLWSLNLDLLRYIMFEAPLTFSEKLDFFAYGYESIFITYDSLQSIGLILMSVLFGINAAMFVYVVRNGGFKTAPKKSGVGAFGLAIVGGGCVACGTSILTPLLVTFGATSSALLHSVSSLLTWISVGLLIFSIYTLSLIASGMVAKLKLSKSKYMKREER